MSISKNEKIGEEYEKKASTSITRTVQWAKLHYILLENTPAI
jgi:hypothetical protein